MKRFEKGRIYAKKMERTLICPRDIMTGRVVIDAVQSFAVFAIVVVLDRVLYRRMIGRK